MKHYFINVIGGVDAEIIGPYKTDDKRDAEAKQFRYNEQSENDSIFALDITELGDPVIWSYSAAFMEA